MNNLNFDPHAVLNVPKNADINQIKNAFVNLSRTSHPDRGGNPEIFKVIRSAYDYLVKVDTLSNNQNSFYHPLSNQKNDVNIYDVNERANRLAVNYVPIPDSIYRKNNQQSQQNQQKYQHPQQMQQTNKSIKQYFQTTPQNTSEYYSRPSSDIKRFPTSSSMNNERFNKAFEDGRVKNINDYGYGEMMDKSSGSRLDIDALAKKDGNHFENQMIVYTKPQELDSNTSNAAHLGQGKINDYSSSVNSQGIQYSDYRIAMSNAQRPQGKISSKTLNSLQQERKREIPKQTQEEIKMENEEKRRLELEEMNRQYRQHQLDQEIFRNHQRMQPTFDRMKQ